MLPPTRRVALDSAQQSYPRSLAQRLIRPCANGWINYLHGLGLLRIDIQCLKMHAKAVFKAAESLFYCPRVLNYVRYIGQYARITLEVREAICLACVRRGTTQVFR